METTSTSPPGTVVGVPPRIIAFFALVFLGIATQVAFKLSQRNGKYEYNTMSAMVVVEFIKLYMSAFQHFNDNGNSIEKASEDFRGVQNHVYLTYFLLAVSYAVYNQLVFAVMGVAEPGTFSLLKSFTPVIVSVLNCSLFGEALTVHQWYCIFIQVFGIIPVIATKECFSNSVQLGYALGPMGLMIFTITMGSVNTVYNAKVIKELSLPIAVQNCILYLFGIFTNFLLYLCSRAPTSDSQHFFYGYNNPGVILLLILNSFVGIAITIIYKYGDAVLKTMTGPLSSAILVYISYVFFGMSLDLVKASGAAVVVIVTLLYLSLPSAPRPKQDLIEQSQLQRRKKLETKWLILMLLLFLLFGIQLIAFPKFTSVATESLKASVFSRMAHKNVTESLNVSEFTRMAHKNVTESLNASEFTRKDHKNVLPIMLVIQALRMEAPNPSDPMALQINKEKLSIFESYRPHFRHVIFDSPLYPGEKDACNDAAFDGLNADCRHCNYTRPLDGVFDEHRYACAAEIFEDSRVTGVMGALVIHADFYLLPAFVNKTMEKLMKYPHSFWLAEKVGTDHPEGARYKTNFTNGTVPQGGWHWPREWRKVEAFRDDLAKDIGYNGRLPVPSAPISWADLYYTPVAFWEHFLPFARLMMKHKIINEVAIPLAHQMIAEMYHLDRGVPQICLGGCCVTSLMDHLQSAELMSTRPCGHRIDLVSAESRQALLDVWRENHSSL